ncbi:interleukin-1 beta-like [Conger conger]|uniref:interleukin-1 beta-like n=1 Tax=Conger conger TaxID=82655 RepID=UPI002A5A0EFA|nr:interleukin-1 beta-like [Conger conger]XP_061117344.1 interleukin-1 beta-like [Conger conger]
MEFKSACIAFEKIPSCDHNELHLEVTQHPHSLRDVANIIVALHRMKHSYTPRGTEFSDHELLDIMLENVFEESVTPVAVDTWSSKPNVFYNTKVIEHSVCDQDQKSLVLHQSPLELHAVILQAASMHLKVNLNLSTYMSRNFTDSQRRPVALSIAGKDLYLSCSKSGSDPILQLEKVKDRTMLKNIDANGETARFLFLKSEQGLNTTSLESLKFRGWFVSTAVEDRRPVEMCKEDDSAHFTNFSFTHL